MERDALEIAARVIAQTIGPRRADALLRAELRHQRGVSQSASRAAAGAVFNYYRWLQWVQPSKPLVEKLRNTCDLAEKFARDPFSFSDEELLTRAIPPWVRQHVAVSPAWLRSLQRIPKLWLRAKSGQAMTTMQRLGGRHRAAAGPLPNSIEYRGVNDLFATKEFQAGEFEMQDISSQAIGWICNPQPGEVWWDACAGEGGKLLHLADLMKNKGLIWASDRSAQRLKVLKRRAARAKAFNYRAALWNGDRKPPTKTRFDGVLVDAPCSGIGTWQRNPHARWTTTERDIDELKEVQCRLLANAAGSLKPGGRLVYAVCTLSRAETTDVVEAFLRESSDFEPLEVPDPFAFHSERRNQHWFWPETHDGNGMFVAAFRRK